MNILITGSKGFIGKNLKSHLVQNLDYIIHEYNRGDSIELLKEKISISDIIFHLAGENRTENELNFEKNNYELAKEISNFLSTQIEWVPVNKINLNEEDKEKMNKFLEILEEDDDVQNVFTNAI